jgi:hypothetical protein
MTVSTGTYAATYGTTAVNAAVFIPELWSDEVIATYKSNLVLANAVTRMNHNGKKGDVIRIPTPERGDAYAKAASTAVTLQYKTETDLTITINKHYEYSRLIEDIASIQALVSMRQFYTDDAGYALARQVDRSLFLLAPYLQAGTVGTTADTTWGSALVQGNDGSTVFTGAAGLASAQLACQLTDVGIRKMVQTIDDNDTPLSDRVIVVPPVEKKNLLGLARFTEQAFVGESGGGNSIRTGKIGSVYGIDVLVSTNCPYLLVDGTGYDVIGTWNATAPGADTDYSDILGTGVRIVDWSGTKVTVGDYRVGVLLHKGAWALVEQMGVRSQSQYKQEFLADLFTADTIYGVGELRDTAGVAFAVPA